MALNIKIGKENNRVNKMRAISAKQKGFTLIELMIVITMIGILATLALPTFRYSHIRAKEAVLKKDLFYMRECIDQFYVDKERYPYTLEDLVTEGYLRSIPVDPFTESAETWVEVYIDWEKLEPDEEPGIWDIHSGSYEQALDGTYYREW